MKSYPQNDALTGREIELVSPLGEKVKARLVAFDTSRFGLRGWRMTIPTFGMDVHELYLRGEGWLFPELEMLEANADHHGNFATEK